MLFLKDRFKKYMAIGAVAVIAGASWVCVANTRMASAAKFEPISKLQYTPMLSWPAVVQIEEPVIVKASEPKRFIDDTQKDSDITIFGKSVIAKDDMVAYIKGRNPRPKLSCTVEELVNAYYDEAAAEGVRGDIALCQAIKETGTFNYGGDVKPRQNNFCGLGATGGGAPGYSFSTARIGARAHIQHLLAYASNRLPSKALVDPRYNILVTVHPDFHGRIKVWTGLNGKWAVPGHNYGQEILAIWRDAKKHSFSASVPTQVPPFVTVRDDLSSLILKVQKNPEDLDLRNKLAKQEAEAKLYNEALKDYEKVLDKDKKNINAYLGQAEVYQKQDRYDDAKDAYDKGLKKNKKNPELLAARANFYVTNEKYKDAIKDFNEILKQKDEDASALYNRSALFAMTKQYKKAIKDYDKLIELLPDKAELYYNRGVVYEQQKKTDKALKDYRKAINMDKSLSAASEGIKRLDAVGKRLLSQSEDE